MKKLFCKKALCGLLVLILAISTCVFASAADVASGSAGNGITWKLDSNGKLTVTGTGKMTSLTLLLNQRPKVKSVVIGNGITEINNSAFTECTALTSVSFPSTLQIIGTSAFEGCTKLASVTLPANLTSIYTYAFAGCTKLSSITIPGKVTAIGNSAFKGCTSLTSVTVPANVTSMPYYVFKDCTNLTTVTFEANVSNCIFKQNFEGCKKLTAINVPSGHTMYSSKDGVVFNKEGTTILYYPDGKSGAYSIPSTVTEIDSRAFRDCAGLTSLVIPEGVKSIGFNCFQGCTGLKNVTLPRSISSIGSQAFSDCPLTAVTLYDSVFYIADDAFGPGVEFTVPEGSYAAKWAKQHNYPMKTVAKEYKVTITYNSNFGTASATPVSGKAGTQVTLKATANKGYKFTGWTVLGGGITVKNNKFTIGNSDILIRANFEVDKSSAVVKGLQYKLDEKKKTAILVRPESAAVSSVTIPATIKAYGTKYKVVEIAANAFKGCASLTKVTIGAEITKIGKNAFNGCKKLKTVTIKTTKLTKKGIGSGSFKNISAKTTFKLPGKQKKDYQTWLVKTGKAPKKAKFK